MAQLHPQALDSLFVAYGSQSYGGGIRTGLHTGLNSLSKSKSESLYDWRFTANRFVLASSRLRPDHDHSWHRAPLGPMAIYLFSVNTFVFFVVPPLIKREGLGFFIIGVPLLHLIREFVAPNRPGPHRKHRFSDAVTLLRLCLLGFPRDYSASPLAPWWLPNNDCLICFTVVA
jgi:hypothetical protein